MAINYSCTESKCVQIIIGSQNVSHLFIARIVLNTFTMLPEAEKERRPKMC